MNGPIVRPASAADRTSILALLRQAFDPDHVSSPLVDFNNVGLDAVVKYLQDNDPDNWRSQNKTSQEYDAHYRQVAAAMLEYRNNVKDGLIRSLDE